MHTGYDPPAENTAGLHDGHGAPSGERRKSAAEIDIENRWRRVLLEGASTGDFQRAYDELHAEFIRQAECARQDGDDVPYSRGGIYAQVNPRPETEDRLRSVILHYVGSWSCLRGRPSRVLEVGTGDGRTAHLLACQGNTVLSVDVSRLALDRARSRWGGDPSLSLQYEFGDARGLDLPDASFDFVVSENMVEHLSPDDMRAHLGEVRRLLAPGGSYLLYTPSRLWSGRISAGFHLHVYTLRELTRLLQEFDFRPIWLEPRLLHRTGRLYPISGLGLWIASLWESVLSALRVHAWPLSLKTRIIPGIMVCGHISS